MKTRSKVLRPGLVVVLVAVTVSTVLVGTAAACEQPFLGQICHFGFNFCPSGFLPADGRLLPINQNQALFALLGTVFGGDGQTTFALPDLRGRTAVGTGQGPGLDPVALGQTGGGDQTLTVTANPRGSQVDSTQLPFLGLTACIAVNGIFPPRD